jgi:hypothetical protein
VLWAVLTTDGLALVGGGGTADGRILSDGSGATRGLAVRPGTSTMQHIRRLLPPARSSRMAAILNAILSPLDVSTSAVGGSQDPSSNSRGYGSVQQQL